MKIRTLEDVEAFKKVINECKGEVWLESVYGDKYNLKSALTQYVAIADLMRDNKGDLELFAQLPEDESKLISFFSSLAD